MKEEVTIHLSVKELTVLIKEAVRSALEETYPVLKPKDTVAYLTRVEVANRLRLSLPTLNTLTKSELLIGYKIGGRVLYKEAEVEAMVGKINIQKYKRKTV